MRKAIIVLSGGQDSTTCLAFMKYVALGPEPIELHAVTFDYGQTHSREIRAARDVAKLAGVASHEVVEVGPILDGKSPLTNPQEQLETYDDHDSMAAIIGNRVEKTFVPMRNALFLTLAANRAAVLGAELIVTGVCEADNANYPDCRLDFITAQETAINEALGTLHGEGPAISIYTPLINRSKPTSVNMMANFGVETYAWLAFSHTAYDGNYPPVGKDHASVLRAHGFEMAGLPDPLVLRANLEGKMNLPSTPNYENGAFLRATCNAIMDHYATLGYAC